VTGAGETLRRRLLRVYDLRTNQHFTLEQNPLRRQHLDELVACYAPAKARSERVESERFKAFPYDELVARDKANLGLSWLRDEPLEDRDNLPAPEITERARFEARMRGCHRLREPAIRMRDQRATTSTDGPSWALTGLPESHLGFRRSSEPDCPDRRAA